MVLTSPKSAHKSMKEQFESVSSYIVDYLWDQPAIYCGTYKKYNEGSLFGAWLDLRTFDSYEEFIDVCMQLHADEEDPELMFQDYQCFPAEWYSESCMDEEVFDKIIAFIQMDDENRKHLRLMFPPLAMTAFRILKIIMRANMIRKRISPHTSSMSAMIWSA